MATHPNGSHQSLTPQDIDAWLHAATERYAALHRQAASPWPSSYLHDVLTEMSDLFQKSLEELRMVSQSLQERSLAVQETSGDLSSRSTRLRERSEVLMERMKKFTPPPPEAIREAESRVLELFRKENGREKPSGAKPG
jgi:hypothetical protein